MKKTWGVNVAKNQTNEEKNKLNNKRMMSLGLAVTMSVSVLIVPVKVNAGTIELKGGEQKQE